MKPYHSAKKKKKTAHAYFGRLYFSKFFGGKITSFLTDVTYRVSMNEKKTRKLNVFKQLLPKKTTNFKISFFGPLVQT